MAVRTIKFMLSAADITPATIQSGGMQYEHNATQVIFTFPKALRELIENNTEQLCYRIDVSNGEGGYYPSEEVEPTMQGEDVILTYLVPYEVTSAGGLCRLTVVVSLIDKNNCEKMIFCSAPALIEFEQVARGSTNAESFKRELSGAIKEVKECIIACADVNSEGELIITYSSGAIINAGVVSLPDTDDTPVQNSIRPVKSGGVFSALKEKQDKLIFDSLPKQNSNNPVTSNGVYNAIAYKQDKLIYDDYPKKNSDKMLTSGVIYDELSKKHNLIKFEHEPKQGSMCPVTGGGIYNALAKKQDVLNFDEIPTENSNNPVMSKGVFGELNAIKDNHVFKDEMCNALKNIVKGNGLTIYDISPIRHNLRITVSAMDNALPYPFGDTTHTDENGMTYIDNGDGSIIVNGTSLTYDTIFNLLKAPLVLPCGNYTFSMGSNVNNINAAIYDADTNLIASSTGSDISFELTKKTVISQCYIYPVGNRDYENVVIEPIIKVNSIDLSTVIFKKYGDDENEFIEYVCDEQCVIEGVESNYPVLNLKADVFGVNIECEYNRDITKAFEKTLYDLKELDGVIGDINTILDSITDGGAK